MAQRFAADLKAFADVGANHPRDQTLEFPRDVVLAAELARCGSVICGLGSASKPIVTIRRFGLFSI